ncbi:hypothetical protein SCB71_02800 [Herbiconiux sp. KACC 21604]|uniref:hypothetical protein n=1 Tax=unclassified Herbiconiux TaxID=2618217 RepID=UPI0020A4AA8B|nr:hypothetical protein [Herbiconiux sp. SALV-R1]WPO87185.1 hypothetical protein SCB71_02800 [Herbiconiux sp. KACC 21604]
MAAASSPDSRDHSLDRVGPSGSCSSSSDDACRMLRSAPIADSSELISSAAAARSSVSRSAAPS